MIYERFFNFQIMIKVCKQMEAMNGHYGGEKSSLLLKMAMGVSQHHDAVSGTEKQHVTYDYAKRLAIGASICQVCKNSNVYSND